jgi:Na+/H+ antiporter NhaD/arsenite permease-like protein
MVVVAGLRHAGAFTLLAHKLCAKAASARAIGVTLVLLSFFSAMLITNDVALLTFVPFAVVVLGMAKRDGNLIWVVVLQTVAANLGSVLTPVGNPQNLYLYSHYDLSIGDFLSATFPLWLMALVIVLLLCLRLPNAPLEIYLGEEPNLNKKGLVLYFGLFALCLTVVLRLLSWEIMLPVLILILLVLDRQRLKQADFLLLLTFVCFFVFAGNLSRIEAVEELLRRVLNGRELITGALTSQVISNVPSAILLSGFTANGRELLLGVNIGGLGTPVASLASLISLKLYSHSENASTARFLKVFSAVNFSLLIALLVIYQFVM